jgi:Na+-transporting methylmalonyl-CoA/oxaloacetate decarboxylase gamma subunit
MTPLFFTGIAFVVGVIILLILVITEYAQHDPWEITRRDEPITLEPAHIIQTIKDERPSFLGGPEGANHE